MVKRQIHQKVYVYDLFIIYVELMYTYEQCIFYQANNAYIIVIKTTWISNNKDIPSSLLKH
jgi:hypothetical protein